MNVISGMLKTGGSHFASDKNGGIAIMSAFVISLSVTLAALSVDTISVFLEKRKLQSVTDLAAIIAAQDPTKADELALKIFRQNGFPNAVVATALFSNTPSYSQTSTTGGGSTIKPVYITITKGAYSADPTIDPEGRFVVSSADINAVKVAASAGATLYFGAGLVKAPVLHSIGIASASDKAAIAIGTRLASLNGGVINSVLSALFGTSVSLSVADYNSLASASVSVMPFLDALATELHLQALTYDQLLNSDVTFGELMNVLGSMNTVTSSLNWQLSHIGDRGAAKSQNVDLKKLFGIGNLGQLNVGGGDAAFESRIGVLNLMNAALALANEDHQVEFKLIQSLPGIAEIEAHLAIGEKMQTAPFFSIGPEGTIVRTAQIRLLLNAKLLGSASLAGLAINLPLYVESAYGEARIQDIACTATYPVTGKVETAVKPGLASLAIATMDSNDFGDFNSRVTLKKATMVSAPLVKISALGKVEITNINETKLQFTQSDIPNRTVKSVSTRDFLATALQSLLSNLETEVTVGGLSLISSKLFSSALISQITSVAGTLDSVVATTLDTIGIKVGEADVMLTGLDCGSSVLVQ